MAKMERELITFEQPLNETVRLCLRLEYLFMLFNQEVQTDSKASSHLAMTSLLKMLNVIDRPDIKSKITQALSQHATTLGQLKQIEGVDPARLNHVLAQLDQSLQHFHGNHKRIGENLRSNTFLSQLSGHLNNPAGLCPFATPAYTLWCKKKRDARIDDLKRWFIEFHELEHAVNLILRLTRDSTPAKVIDIEEGFYHQTLDSALPTQLVRIELDSRFGVYPEMSVGKHHLSIRFMYTDDATGRAHQYKEPISCSLACCRL